MNYQGSLSACERKNAPNVLLILALKKLHNIFDRKWIFGLSPKLRNMRIDLWFFSFFTMEDIEQRKSKLWSFLTYFLTNVRYNFRQIMLKIDHILIWFRACSDMLKVFQSCFWQQNIRVFACWLMWNRALIFWQKGVEVRKLYPDGSKVTLLERSSIKNDNIWQIMACRIQNSSEKVIWLHAFQN